MSSSEQAHQPTTETIHPGLMGTAVLALWGGVDPTQEEAFNDWYTHEHIPERIAVPGFLRARRFVSCLADPRTAGWRYFTLYEVQSPEVLRSDAYMAALNQPTPGTLRFLPVFTSMNRTACRVTHSVARGVGGNVALVELGPQPGREQALRDWIAGPLSARNMRRGGTLALHLCEIDEAGTRAGVGVASYREVRPGTGRWLLILEGAWTDPGTVIEDHLRDLEELERNGAAPDRSYGLFRFLGSLSAADLQRSRPISEG